MKKLAIAYLVLLSLIATVLYTSFGLMLVRHEMFARVIDNRILLTDFVNHYNAGLLSRRTAGGEQINIYDPNVQWQSQLAVTAPLRPERPFYLQYPPHFFAIALPLSMVNTDIAWVLWTCLGMALTVWSLLRLLHDYFKDGLSKALAIISVLVTYPTWLSVGMGQTAMFNFAAIVAFLMFLRSGRNLAAGIIESIICIKLQYAPLTFIVGLVVGGRKFLLGFGLAGLVLAIYSIAVLGLDNILQFPQALLTYERSGGVTGVSPTTMQNIRGALALAAGQDNAAIHYLSFAIFVIALGAVAFFWRKYYVQANRDSESFKLLSCLTVPVLLFTSLHTHAYDYILMSIPCIWLWELTSSTPLRMRTRVLRALALAMPLLSWVFAAGKPFFQIVKVQPELLWGVAVWLVAIAEFRARTGRTGQAKVN